MQETLQDSHVIPANLQLPQKNYSGVTDKKQRIFRSLQNADKKLFIFEDADKEMLIFEHADNFFFIFEHADNKLFIFEDADKNCFQTSTTSTLLATAEPAMTTTVAFAGASFDHEHGDDGQHFGDILLHLISISTKTHLQWDIERKRRRRGNYYMAPPQHCRPPPLGGCSIIMIRIYRGPA